MTPEILTVSVDNNVLVDIITYDETPTEKKLEAFAELMERGAVRSICLLLCVQNPLNLPLDWQYNLWHSYIPVIRRCLEEDYEHFVEAIKDATAPIQPVISTRGIHPGTKRSQDTPLVSWFKDRSMR